MTCACNPAYSQSCPACDGTLAELQPDDLGEVCIAYEDGAELCPRRAETGSPYCLTHQYLATDRLVAA
jgi:hypothetical protein